MNLSLRAGTSLVVLFWAALCPAAEAVMPLVLPQGQVDLQGMDQRVYDALQKQTKFLLGQVKPWKGDASMKLLTESKSTEHWIRPNAGTVAGLCFLRRFGPYDPKAVGLSRDELLAGAILPMMRYLLATHVTGERPTGDGKKWGDHWQSALWTAILARGAWWAWADLSPDVQAGVRRVVAHEADRIAKADPPYQIRLDTKAEENAWNSQVLSAAVLLMPADARRAVWEKAHWRWVISSFLRPADAKNQALVDGRKVCEIFEGANIHDDFTLENHRIVHPDYMGTFGLTMAQAQEYVLSGRRPPEALAFNAAGIYENLKWMVLPDGGYVYPNGQDWQLFRNADWLGVHALMAVYGRDGDAWELAERCLKTMEAMQRRPNGGAIYAPGETFFASSQSDRMVQLSVVWLALRSADQIRRSFTPRLGVRRLDAGKIILRRTPRAVHTVSWGPVVMAQCVPNRLDRIVSPDMANGLGRVRLADGKPSGPLKVTLVEARVSDRADGFEAALTVDHGRAVRAELRFASESDGSWTMSERLTALEAVTTARIATGQIAVLNNPAWVYEKGRRELAVDARTTTVEALSGKVVEADGARRIVIDSAIDIRSERPLHARYVGASRPERSRASDVLSLNWLDGPRSWRKGQTISEYRVRVTCGE